MKKPNLLIGLERNFLNLPDQISLTSLIAYKVRLRDYDYKYDKEEEEDPDKYNTFDITLVFKDCNNTVDFDFDIKTEEGMENSLYKIDTMINTLSNFRQKLLEAKKLIKR
jgi:hypothetical protein